MVGRIGLVAARSQVEQEIHDLARHVPADVVVIQGRGAPGALDRTAAGGGSQVAGPSRRGGTAALHRPGAGGPGAPDGADLDALIVDAASPPVDLPAVQGPRIVVHRAGECAVALALAGQLGISQVAELPTGRSWLVEALRPAGLVRVLTILGCAGGVGASTLAIACAAAAPGECLLVDADPRSAGLDLPLGIGDGEGARWESIPDGEGALDAESLRAALPAVRDMAILTGPMPQPAGTRLSAVLDVGRREFAHAVVDGGRERVPGLGEGLSGDAVEVLVTPATLAGVVGARRLASGLGARSVLVVRPTPWLGTAEVAEHVGIERCVELPRLRRAAELADGGDLLSGRTGRRLQGIGRQVWRAAA